MIFLQSLGNVNMSSIAFCSCSTDGVYNGSFAFKYSTLCAYCICTGFTNQNVAMLFNKVKTKL